MMRRTVLLFLLIAAAMTTHAKTALAQPAPPLPRGPYLATQDLPDFRFKVRISGEIPGAKVAGCVQETLCVSGALPGRSELFVRIIGPRPNGFFWLNLVRFTPSEIEVWAERRSTGTVRYYRLAPLARTSDRLNGFVDKTAFPVAPGSSVLRATAPGAGSAPVVASIDGPATFVSPVFPGYQFTVRIVADGERVPARQEGRCLPETVCVSGSLPGRSEVFLRLIGPRPNGFFHVNIVRFTPSRVEVVIRRLSTGERRTYTLPAIPRSSSALNGRLDRTAFSTGGGDLPPDPGSANDATLAGIDSDGDGLRDDVQRFIALEYGDSPDTAAALRQQAEALLGALVDSDRGRTVIDDAEAANRALECLMAVDSSGGRLASAELTAQVVDTERRLREYLDYNAALAGQVLQVRSPSQWLASCQFELQDNRLRQRLREAVAEEVNSCVDVSDVTLFVVNGVWTPLEGAYLNAATLFSRLQGASIPAGARLTVAMLYNPHEGYIADFWEAARQRGQLETSRFLEALLGAIPMPEFMRGIFLDLSRAAEATVLLSDAVLRDHLEVYREEFAEGKRVIVVAHSQGNFFANQSWRLLTDQERRSLGIVSVANPDSRVEDGRGRWTTHARDLVIAAIPGSLPPNVAGPVGNLLGHGFVGTYLLEGSPAQRRIVSQIEATVPALDPPNAIAEDGVVTVTLTWGSQPDVDLHVIEPGGAHVFYRNQRGVAGALDVDDTNGFGPEHYVIPCATLRPGTYLVGVNYYFGGRPETARIKIDAGFVTRRFSEYLPVSRGSLGDGSPIPVARIVVTENGSEGYSFQVIEE